MKANRGRHTHAKKSRRGAKASQEEIKLLKHVCAVRALKLVSEPYKLSGSFGDVVASVTPIGKLGSIRVWLPSLYCQTMLPRRSADNPLELMGKIRC